MSKDSQCGAARNTGMTDDERQRVLRAHYPAEVIKGNTGARAVAADQSATVGAYLRSLRNLSVEGVAQRAKVSVHTIRRLEVGEGVGALLGSEKTALRRVYGREVSDLVQPLSDANKMAALHDLPIEKPS